MFEKMEPQIQEVYPRLFIGNYKGIMDSNLLKSKSISHIINLAAADTELGAPPLDFNIFKDLNIEYYPVIMSDFQDVDDNGQQVKLFKEVAAKIEEFFKSSESANVVVNCFAGLSRSSSCVMAYLILYKNMSAMEAVKMIKTERDILPNNSNLAHLATIHNEKFGFTVDKVFDVEKGDRDLQREMFNNFLKVYYDSLTSKP